jgi:hypothetical protein
MPSNNVLSMLHLKRFAFLTWIRIAVTVLREGFPVVAQTGNTMSTLHYLAYYHCASRDKFPKMFGFDHLAVLDSDDVVEPHSVALERLTKWKVLFFVGI